MNYYYKLLIILLALSFNVNAQVSASFEADTLEGCDILAGVEFTDLSTGNIISWEWNFGNGSSSTLQNPTASYVLPGNYDVQLVVSDGVSSDTLILEDYIIVHESPKVDYSVDTTSGCTPIEVFFQDLSQMGSNPILNREWDFGDGAPSSNMQTITHRYNNGGSFPTSLIVTDTEGCEGIKNGEIIEVTTGPITDFSSKGPSSGCTTPLVVDFTNLTKNHSANVVYTWDFGDGTTSNLRNPTKTYTALGSYDVKLVASNGVCTDSITIERFVDIGETEASFSTAKDIYCFKRKELMDESGNPIIQIITDTLRPTDLSTGASNYEWDFGDGTISTEKEPWHVYKDTGWYDIKLEVSSGVNCLDDTTISIYVQSVHARQPILDEFIQIPARAHACLLPDTFYFNDESINAVQWDWRFQTTSGLVLTDNAQNPTFVQRDTGVFIDTLIVTSIGGCRDTLPLCIKGLGVTPTRISALPQVLINTDTTTSGCSPYVINFSDSLVPDYPGIKLVPNSWSWDFDNGQTSTDSLPPPQTFVDDTTYTVEYSVQDTSGCTVSAEVTVKIGLKGEPTIIIREDSLCISDSLIMEARSPIIPKIEKWEWYLYQDLDDEEEEPRRFNSSRAINWSVKEDFIDDNVSRDPALGEYGIEIITVYNGCNDTTRLDPNLFILGPDAEPFFELDSCGGFQVNFFTQALDADTYLWDFGDSTTADTNNPTHVFPRSGRFRQKYTIGNSVTGCEVVDSFNLDISPIVPGIIIQDTVGCSPFHLVAQANDNMFVSYEWIIPGVLSSSKRELDIIIDTSGVFTLELILGNGFGCKDTSYQQIFVNGPKAEMDIEVLNECIPLNVAFRDQTNYEASPRKSIKWDFGNGLFSNRTFETTQYFQRDSLYSVTLIIEDNEGCTDTLTYKDTILTPDILVDFSAVDDSLCLGEELILLNESTKDNFPTFTWDFGDGTLITKEDSAEHVYQEEKEFDVTLKMTNVTGCEIETTKVISVQDKPIVGFTADTLNANCFPLRVNFSDTSKSDYLAEWIWDFGAAGKAFFQNPPKTFNNRGSYDVSLTAITSNGCTDSLTKPAYINIDGPDASFTISEDTVCKFEDVTFTIQDPVGVGSFSWDFGDGNTGTGSPITYQYKRRAGVIRPVLLLSDASNDCQRAIVDSLFVEDVIASFEVDDTIGCEPHSINITNNSQRADELGWDFGDGNSSLDLNPSNIYLTNGIYEIVLNIRNQNGCVDTAYQTIVVQAQPIVETSNDTTICEGDTITLFSRGGAVYRWSPNPDTNIIGRFLAEPRVFPVENTFYNVEVFTSEGCLDSGQVQVDVQPKPEEYTLIEDTTLIIGEELALDVESGPSYSYMWSPNEWINCIDCPTPIVQPLATTIYMVDINDPFNCFPKKDSINIEVIVDFSIAVPEAFSPNNDGVNDIIYVKGWGIKELLEFKIYNRWGELVFETNDINKGWDGTYRGVPQNIETYVYTISVNTHLDEVLTKRGNFSLLR